MVKAGAIKIYIGFSHSYVIENAIEVRYSSRNTSVPVHSKSSLCWQKNVSLNVGQKLRLHGNSVQSRIENENQENVGYLKQKILARFR